MPFNHPISLDLHCHTLDNGLRLVLHRDVRLPLAALSLWYHVGAKNERPGRTGFAHLFEHLLFQGSQHVQSSDHFRHVQEAGGVANGSTSRDRTNYHEVLPSHRLELGLWLESDRMGFFLPAIDQEKLENQREVVLNERRQRMDNQPYGLAYETLDRLLFPTGHPHSWPIIGYAEDIVKATLDEVRDFFKTHYIPNNAILTIAGDIDYRSTISLCEHYFGELPAGEPPTQPEVPPIELREQQRSVLEDQVNLSRIYMGFHGPPFGTREWFAAEMLCTLLSEGKSSLLHEDLVYRQKLAQDVVCFIMSTEASATFYVVSTVKPGVAAERLEAGLSDHLNAIAEGLFSTEQMERARNQLLTTHYSHLQSLDQRAELLARYATFHGDPNLLGQHAEHYLSLGAEDLQAFAATHLSRQQSAVLTVVPKPETPKPETLKTKKGTA
jgi:zinc protease